MSLRDSTDTCVVRVNSHRTTKLHLPDDSDDSLPLCSTTGPDGRGYWHPKPMSAFPEGYAEWCEDCELLHNAKEAER